MTSALQKSQCCSAASAAQHSENCNATFVFACGMLQGWGLEGSGLGLTDQMAGVFWVLSASAVAHQTTQEWPRQTKPKKGQFMNFSQGHSGTKVRYVNRACFPKEKHQNDSQKWAKFMNFSFWPFLWFGLPARLLKEETLQCSPYSAMPSGGTPSQFQFFWLCRAGICDRCFLQDLLLLWMSCVLSSPPVVSAMCNNFASSGTTDLRVSD